MSSLLAMEPDYVTARLWEVSWADGGFGKHGRGPFATQEQAEACIRAIGWVGRPVLVVCTLHKDHLARIQRKLKTGLPGRDEPVPARRKSRARRV